MMKNEIEKRQASEEEWDVYVTSVAGRNLHIGWLE